MNKKVIYSLLIFATCCAPATVAEAPYELVWEDTFEGTALDETHWNIEVNGNGGGNNELQYYRRDNVSVGVEPESGASCLILTARRETYGEHQATSGRINTKGKVYMTHGKIEASIKLPCTADGLWPAFWMMGNDYPVVGWPRCGEIDILEMGHADGIKSATQDRLFNGALHYGVSYRNVQHTVQSAVSDYGLQDGKFHLYTLVWDENRIAMYLDNAEQPYYVADISRVAEENDCGNFFHKPFFIILNLAVGGEFTGIQQIEKITALADGSAAMYVDYVRVYQQQKNLVEQNGITQK